MINAVILERKSLKNTFWLMVKLFWRSRELNVVKHMFGPNRPSGALFKSSATLRNWVKVT